MFTTLEASFRSASDSQRPPRAPELEDQSQSQYLAQTSGLKSACVSGAISKRFWKRSSPTSSTPSSCTRSQLSSTAVFGSSPAASPWLPEELWALPAPSAPALALTPSSPQRPAGQPRCEAGEGVLAGEAAPSGWNSRRGGAGVAQICRHLNSFRRFRSFSTWPLGTPIAFRSASSISRSVSMSSQPFSSRGSMYCRRPALRRKAAASLAS
mmetsp:Transcript_22072/g.69609  ORF Transcript_22072/g.69609 Transcript_22072/m.69609 type:complete len:211 (+) Transcript_22072:394-1026(+)